MIKSEDWLMMRNLINQGLNKSEIASRLGITRKTVSRNLLKSSIPKYVRKERGKNILSNYKCYIDSRLEKYNLSVKKLFEEIKLQGYDGGYQTVSNYVNALEGSNSDLNHKNIEACIKESNNYLPDFKMSINSHYQIEYHLLGN